MAFIVDFGELSVAAVLRCGPFCGIFLQIGGGATPENCKATTHLES